MTDRSPLLSRLAAAEREALRKSAEEVLSVIVRKAGTGDSVVIDAKVWARVFDLVFDVYAHAGAAAMVHAHEAARAESHGDAREKSRGAWNGWTAYDAEREVAPMAAADMPRPLGEESRENDAAITWCWSANAFAEWSTSWGVRVGSAESGVHTARTFRKAVAKARAAAAVAAKRTGSSAAQTPSEARTPLEEAIAEPEPSSPLRSVIWHLAASLSYARVRALAMGGDEGLGHLAFMVAGAVDDLRAARAAMTAGRTAGSEKR